MAQTLGANRNTYLTEMDFTPAWAHAFRALDAVRVKNIDGALEEFYGDDYVDYFDANQLGFNITTHFDSPHQFKIDMRRLANELEKYGY